MRKLLNVLLILIKIIENNELKFTAHFNEEKLINNLLVINIHLSDDYYNILLKMDCLILKNNLNIKINDEFMNINCFNGVVKNSTNVKVIGSFVCGSKINKELFGIIYSRNYTFNLHNFMNFYKENLNNNNYNTKRYKRNTKITRKVCNIHMFADHLFFKYHNYSSASVLADIFAIVSDINYIFSSTDFNDDGINDNIGISLTGVTIVTPNQSREDNYVLNDNLELAEEFLIRFSLYNFSSVCAAIALTNRPFKDRLGKQNYHIFQLLIVNDYML